jgi:hypothetical protein
MYKAFQEAIGNPQAEIGRILPSSVECFLDSGDVQAPIPGYPIARNFLQP